MAIMQHCDDKKIASLLIKRKQTNPNTQKIPKTPRELLNMHQKEPLESILCQIN